MIGRQFSYYCCPEDLAEIEARVFRPLGGRLLSVEKRDGKHHISEAFSFSLPINRMGKESLSLLLSPPASMEKILYQGDWLDVELSHLIEINRCYIKNGVIHPARFWYVPKTYVDRVCVNKPDEFLKWAQTVYRKTKLLLSKHPKSDNHRYEDWFGEVAWQEVSNGKLRAAAN